MKTKLHLLGDVHGDRKPIAEFVKRAELNPSELFIQLGDWGVAGSGWGNNDHPENWLVKAPSNLKVLGGNHDDYATLAQFPHNLGRFGVFEILGCKVFFVQGAESIDRNQRTPGLSWWDTEQLTLGEAYECYELWKEVCYDVKLVITHEAPANIGTTMLGYGVNANTTNMLLYDMWKYHEPPLWRFGHWHRKWNKLVGATNFRCLDIDEYETLTVTDVYNCIFATVDELEVCGV